MNIAKNEQFRGPFLVVQLARFGDVIQSKRLIQTLVSRGETHLLVDSSLAGLAGLVYPQAIVRGISAHKAGRNEADMLSANSNIFAELGAMEFERVYNLNFSGLNYALAALFDPDVVSGYKSVNGARTKDAWCGMVTRWSAARTARGINLVDFWANFDASPMAPGEVNPIARPKGGGIGVAVAGRHSRRTLPPEVLAPIVAAAAKGAGAKSINILGGKGDRKAARELSGRLPGEAASITRDLTGRTSYADLIEVVGGLDTLITPDTGSMHLAAHLGVPVQATFLSSAWCFETGPYGLGHKVWQAFADCLPCLESAECTEQVKCLDGFSDRNLLKYLSGSADFEFPAGMIGMVSVFDSLGCTYKPVLGVDPAANERAAFRSLVAEFLGAGTARTESAAYAAELFKERDWMLHNERYHDNYLEFI